ncbi:MAG: iron-containing alcohol dehydrogenase, partial [Ramlibacter sp.]|nr:iron-containing alcohol dehydrogenase [Ramlibacter sp.]
TGSKRAVIFCGDWLEREGELLGLVRGALGERCAGIFAGVVAHSPVASVEAAAAELRRLNADAAIAIGGGSVIVTARAASILAAEGKPARELCTTQDATGALKSPKLLAAKMPQILVPTTPTTAMVKAGSAVFEPETGERLALFDPKTRTSAVFIHPALIASAPTALVVSSSLNTFAMAIEGLTSRTGNPIADGLLMHAMRLIAQHLARPETLDDPAVRGELMIAAVLCGQGTDHTAAGITTVLGHAIGARYHTENGLANAIVLPHVLRFNGDAALSGLEKVAAALGLPRGGNDTVSMVGYSVKSIFSALGIPKRLRDVGVPQDALPAIAELAMGDWFLRGNPRPVREAAQLQEVLQDAW